MAGMRYVTNRFRASRGPDLKSPDAARSFHRSLLGYVPTPLVRRPALARALGVGDLFVKYEGPRFGLGAFKGLGASWALHQLAQMRSGAIGTVSAASEGNHGRAVAWAARLQGIPCVIFLPSHVSSERV